jgi:hypothetical protein
MDGDKFEEADNMDMGVFKCKASTEYSSSATTLEKGILPGLLYKFA